MARRAVAHKLRILSVHQLSVVQVSVLHTGPARRGRTAHCGRGSVECGGPRVGSRRQGQGDSRVSYYLLTHGPGPDNTSTSAD